MAERSFTITLHWDGKERWWFDGQDKDVPGLTREGDRYDVMIQWALVVVPILVYRELGLPPGEKFHLTILVEMKRVIEEVITYPDKQRDAELVAGPPHREN